MRPIKFRAWDEEAEQMFYSDKPFEDDGNYFFEFKSGKLRGFAMRPPRPSSDPMEPPEPYCDDYPVEQFTGLCDENGREIYEGDIVKATRRSKEKTLNGKPPSHINNIMKMVGKSKVIFRDGGFLIKKKSKRGHKCPLNSLVIRFLKLEVIGSVFENKNLLNDSKETKTN